MHHPVTYTISTRKGEFANQMQSRYSLNCRPNYYLCCMLVYLPTNMMIVW